MKPVSQRCASIYGAKDHAVIGVSPFNSHFSEERLTSLFTWAHQTFRAFHVFVPDEATRYTLEAAGYSEGKARRKARRQANYLLNKMERALKATSPGLGLSLVLTNGILERNKRYKALLARVELKFAVNTEFRRQCLDYTRWVLENQVEDPDQLDEAALMHGVRYFLEEMPLFMDSASIVGVRSSVFCYHQCPSALQGLYEDRSNGLIGDSQGFLVVDRPNRKTQAA